MSLSHLEPGQNFKLFVSVLRLFLSSFLWCGSSRCPAGSPVSSRCSGLTLVASTWTQDPDFPGRIWFLSVLASCQNSCINTRTESLYDLAQAGIRAVCLQRALAASRPSSFHPLGGRHLSMSGQVPLCEERDGRQPVAAAGHEQEKTPKHVKA